MNSTRLAIALLLATGTLAGCDGASFHPADRIDEDGDGFFAVEDPAGVLTDREYLIQLAAENPDLDLVASRLDCDDANDNTFPEAAEQCDGADNDCDGSLADFEADLDGDGFSACAWEYDGDEARRDCNDDPDNYGAFQHPDRVEICGYHPDVAGLQLGVPNAARAGRLLDDNCDGELLEGEVDADQDGFTRCRLVPDITAQDLGDITVLDPDDPFDPANPQNGLQSDCIDTNSSVFPENPNLTCLDTGDYNSACGENSQEDFATLFYRDIDGDGDGDADPTDSDGDGVPDVAVSTCSGVAPPGRWVARAPGVALEAVATDCDDFNPNEDGKDRDADGFTTCPNADGLRDCDDGNSDTNPDALEACDAEDNDCDGAVDEDYDDDLDGSFRVTQADIAAGLPSANCAARGSSAHPYVQDCDDSDPTRENLDLDADGESTCEGDCNDGDPLQQSADNDGDGFNTCTAIISQFDCDDTNPLLTPIDGDGDGFAPCPNEQGLADCDDDNINVFPNNGAVQCDGVLDTDCDGLTDPLDADDDNDGASECGGDCNDQDPLLNIENVDGDGYSTCTGDCDDTEITVHPGAPQVCGDGITDNDCNGAADTNEADVDGDGSTICEGDCNDFDPAVNAEDADGDGSTSCQGDCDDSDPTITHLTDGDSDGWTACGSFGATGPLSQAVPADCNDDDGLLNWTDADGDSVPTCAAVGDPVTVADCDDFDPAMHDEDRDADGSSPCGADGIPGTADDDCDDSEPEISSTGTEVRDGLDNDCSGIADDGIGDGTEIDTGDLAVVELLVGATAATGDGPAEYFELYNASGIDIDLRGWEVEVTNTTSGLSTTWAFDPAVGPDAAMVIPAGTRAVVARSGNANAYGTNIADFFWSGPAFSDAGGSLELSFEGRPIDTLSWLGSSCIANCEPGQPSPTFSSNSTWRPGHAMGLAVLGSTPHLANNSQSNLCEELLEQVSGLLHGSPGSPQTETGRCTAN